MDDLVDEQRAGDGPTFLIRERPEQVRMGGVGQCNR